MVMEKTSDLTVKKRGKEMGPKSFTSLIGDEKRGDAICSTPGCGARIKWLKGKSTRCPHCHNIPDEI